MTAVSIIAAAPAAGQGNRIETGVDALFAYTSGANSQDVFEVALPMGGMVSFGQPVGPIRIGLFITDQVSVEPSFSLNVVSDEDETRSRVGLAGHVLWHMSGSGVRQGLFFGVGGSMTSFSDDEMTVTQFGASGLAGARIPLTERLAFRVAGGYARFFENADFEARSSVYATAGLSLFAF
jgi:hypothetical protein